MKKLLSSITLIAALALSGSLYAQASNNGAAAASPAVTANQAPDPNAPVMKFERDTIDYGTIPHNADGYRVFKFTNVGKEPLLISNARGSCGCTVPTAPTEPIQPGQASEIKVHYATDRIGGFFKTVTLTSNANPPSKVLVIKGNVLPDATQANPTTTGSPTTPATPATPTTSGH